MISNVSQIIPLLTTSTREGSKSSSSTPATSVADVSHNAVITEGTNATQVNAGNNVPVVGAANTISDAVDYLNANIQNLNRNLEFSIDQQSGEVLVKVLDAHTHELIRQIPSEEALALARNIQRYMLDHHVGLLQHAKA